MTLGRRVKTARKHAKLTQAQLAERVGITQQTLSALERDLNEGSARLLEIALACGVSAAWLARGTGGMLDNGHVAVSGLASQPARLDMRTVADAMGTLRFLMPTGTQFDPNGEVELFIIAYRHMAGDPEISRSDLEHAITVNIATRQGKPNETNAKAGRPRRA